MSSKPIPAINRYKADLRELNFLLFEQFKIDELLGQAPFESWGQDEVKTSLTECYRWVRDVIGPLNATADAEGCHLEDGKVRARRTASSEAWKSLYEAGWEIDRRRRRVRRRRRAHTVQLLVEEAHLRRQHRVLRCTAG